jgi:hypothetical protein
MWGCIFSSYIDIKSMVLDLVRVHSKGRPNMRKENEYQLLRLKNVIKRQK